LNYAASTIPSFDVDMDKLNESKNTSFETRKSILDALYSLLQITDPNAEPEAVWMRHAYLVETLRQPVISVIKNNNVY
jgi:uncharacterized protein (DUF427 family)